MPRKILLADDSVTAQNMGRRILSEAGYEVVTVSNGPAALKKLSEQNPDLVILDIYMPGYGGIEICQKIKENAETASIPVLLTVGKLEPFKADEARRVRADAHLVKPFEATELLAALIKLEDKIVPQDGIRPSGKGAKNKTTNQSSSGKERKFGDSETGWKQRLTIPPPEAKRPEVEQPEAPSTAFREFQRTEGPESSDHEPSSAREGFGQDITAEEIAAITAAAAAFGNNANAPEVPSSDFAVTEEAIAAAVSYMPMPHDTAPEPAPDAPVPQEAALTADATATAKLDAPERILQQPSAAEQYSAEQNLVQPDAAERGPVESVEELPAEAGVDAAEPRPTVDRATDEEVAAVLESLAPANGSAVSAGPRVAEEVFATVDAASSWRNYAGDGARWVAEEIAVPASEASLVLEEEMQKAYAALADLQSGTPIGIGAALAQQNTGSGVPENEFRPTENSTVSDTSYEAAPESRELEVAYAPETPIADNNVMSAELSEPSEKVSLSREDTTREPDVDHAAVAPANTGSGETVEAMAQALEPDATASATIEANAPREESAYAAAAAVGTEFHSINHVDAAPAPEGPESTSSHSPVAPTEGDQKHEAELAAAWAHWRQIRETVANPKFTSQLADAAAAGYKEIHQPEPSEPQSQETASADGESSNAAAADPAAIASIVDSVLAELKPKLVAEIARKLGNK